MLGENENAQKKISPDREDYENGAWMMYVLLCATIQQEMALPEFRKLSEESIETEKSHILSLVEHHKKQSS